METTRGRAAARGYCARSPRDAPRPPSSPHVSACDAFWVSRAYRGLLSRISLSCADLANPKTNWNKTPGYTEAETSSYARILNAAGEEPDAGTFVDVWRARHPDLRHYTYFSYRFNCREKGLGWRLDMCTYGFLDPVASVSRGGADVIQPSTPPRVRGRIAGFNVSLTCLLARRSCGERATGGAGDDV